MDATYRQVIDCASEMGRIRRLLSLPIDGFPTSSALCQSFDRAPMWVWRRLLTRSRDLLDQSGHAAIDSTKFTLWQASPHYLQRIDSSVETLKISFLVDTEEQAILDVQCSSRWPNDATIGPLLARRHIGKFCSLAADKGYDSQSFRDEFREAGVRRLIKHRLFRPVDYGHYVRLDDDQYNQRAMVETVNS